MFVGELETNLERAGLARPLLETQPSLSESDPPAETCRYREPCKLAHSTAELQCVGGGTAGTCHHPMLTAFASMPRGETSAAIDESWSGTCASVLYSMQH